MDQIQEILSSLSPEEQKAVLKILAEESLTGNSKSLNDVYNADYEEIPVDIDTFLESPEYLGGSTDNGRAIYPYWRNAYRKIIAEDKIEIALSGSIGSGKTTAAIYLMIYFFYKLMCLRNIRQYYQLEGNGPVCVAFLNNTIQLSKGVAYDKFMSTVANSPWFLERGEVRGTVNIRYKPKKNIEFIIGSSSDQIIGRDIFCLTGDTKIETEFGLKTLEELCGTFVRVYTFDGVSRCLSENSCTVLQTGLVTLLYHITLADGSIVRCTGNHRFMNTSDIYVEAQSITAGMCLLSANNDIIRVNNVEIVNYDEPVKVYDVINAKPYHNFIIETSSNSVISHNCAIMDELNFSKGADIQFEKNKVLETYNACFGRIKNRFTVNGRCQGRIFMVSSKKTEYDFLNQYIEKKLSSKEDAKNLFVADAKAFEVKPKGSYSGRMFRVAVGGSNLPSKIPEDNETTEELLHQGYEVYDVPVELRGDFELDINRFIADHLGIAVSEVLKFIPYNKLSACYKEIESPFVQEVMEANLDDNIPIRNYFRPEMVPEEIYRKPICIHLDTSGGKGDNCGCSAVAAMGYVDRNRYSAETGNTETTKQMLFRQVFTVGFSARKQSELSFQKVIDFLWYLKYELGWHIVYVSTDGYMGQFLRQQIAASVMDSKSVDYVSLDRTPDGYRAFQTILAEQRLALRQQQLLESEIIRLEQNNVTGKVDHPPIDGCFTGDTLIPLVDGRELSILQLKHEYECGIINHVYTCNEKTRRVEPRAIIKVSRTKTAPVVTLTINSGHDHNVVKCTPEHKFMLINGNYKNACQLTREDKLMPLVRIRPESHFEPLCMYLDNKSNKLCVESDNFRKVKAETHFTHRDNNLCNNTPYNLKVSSTKLYRREVSSALGYKDRLLSIAEIQEEVGKLKDKYSKYASDHSICFVERIERSTELVDVYDISVSGTPNFAICAGVFVHNSKDLADSLAGAVWNAMKHENDLQSNGEGLLDMVIDNNDYSIKPSMTYKMMPGATPQNDSDNSVNDNSTTAQHHNVVTHYEVEPEEDIWDPGEGIIW